MPASAASAAFELRHLQLARAAFAALAAAMITFSPDHSGPLGLSVFGGVAILTGLVWLLAAWLVFPRGGKIMPSLMGVLTILAGMFSSVAPFRTTLGFFLIVGGWALITGLIEGIAGWRRLRVVPKASAPASDARDGVVIGILGVLLAIGLVAVNPHYTLQYYIAEAKQSFTLTGATIAVGLFGGYAAIVAVYLAIAGFSPRRAESRQASPSPVAEERA